MGFDPDAILQKVREEQEVSRFHTDHALTFVGDDAYQVLASLLKEVSEMPTGRNLRPEVTYRWPLLLSVYPSRLTNYRYNARDKRVECSAHVAVHLEAGLTVTRVMLDGKRIFLVTSGSVRLHVLWDSMRKRWTVKESSLVCRAPKSGRAAGIYSMGYGPNRSVSR